MSTTSNPQTLVDLTQLAAAVRCRRRFWLSLGLVGLLLGAALAIVHPAPPTATAELLVTHADDPQDSGAILTDIAVLQSTPIAGAALRSLHESHLTPAQFLTTYQAVNVTDNVLKLTVDGATGTEAVARAKALSDAFIADHAARDRTTAHAQAQAYLDQQKQAKANLAQVDAAIAAAGGSSTGGTATSGNAALEALYAQRANLDSQITSLGNSATQARVGNPAVVAGTKIVDGPRQLPYSRLASLVEYAGVGLLVGLVIGLLLAAVGGVVRDRPTLRREISEHLGASVIAQFTERRRGLVKRLPRRSSAEEERERAAGTIAHLVPADAGGVSMLELGCPRAAATLAIRVAASLAQHGRHAHVVDNLPARDVGALATDADTGVRVTEIAEGPAGLPGTRIGVGSVAAGAAWTDLTRLGAQTLLVVRAGYADSAWLHTVARQLADAQVPIIGVVLIDPDPRDRTDGTLWNGLHTALRGRGEPVGARRAGSAADGPSNQPVVGRQQALPQSPTAPTAPVVQPPTLRAPPRPALAAEPSSGGYTARNGHAGQGAQRLGRAFAGRRPATPDGENEQAHE